MFVLFPADNQEVAEFVEHKQQFEDIVVFRQPPVERRRLRGGAQLRAEFQKMRRLDEVVDRINRLQGSETIVLGAQQYTSRDKDGNAVGKANVFANAIKHDHRSPNPTTRWSDIIRLK